MKNNRFFLIFAKMFSDKKVFRLFFNLHKKCCCIVGVFFLLLASSVFAQDTLRPKKSTFLAYPVAFHLPETRWGAGAGMSWHFFLSKKDSISPPGQAQLGFAYTQNKQVLFSLPFQLFWNQRLHSLNGETGYYDYFYRFFGVGHREIQEETFRASFFQFRINYLRKIYPHIYTGVRWWYEDYRIKTTEEGGQLSTGLIPGSAGSVTSGPGWVFLYDSRDNIYYASSGLYVEGVVHHQSEIWGSHFQYTRYRFDGRYFFPMGKKQNTALQFFGDFISGNVPFSQMPGIGGAKRMRGYYEGRYRDKNLLLFQYEYRVMPIERWGLTVFTGAAWLANNLNNFESKYTHLHAGAGVRFIFDPAKKINMRLDYAIGKNTHGFYLTIGEAF